MLESRYCWSSAGLAGDAYVWKEGRKDLWTRNTTCRRRYRLRAYDSYETYSNSVRVLYGLSVLSKSVSK